MQRIKIDFDNPGLPKRLDVMENDAQSRFFEAELYQGGKAYSAPSGATYSIMYHGFGPQNEGWYDTINDGAGKRAACTVSGNVVTCELARQALQVPGHMTVILCVTASNGYMLKGWPITANVRNDDYNDGEEVEMYFNLSGNVSNAIEQLKKAMAEAEQAKKDIETKAAEALASIPEDYTELDSNVKQLKEDIVNLNKEKLDSDVVYEVGDDGEVVSSTKMMDISGNGEIAKVSADSVYKDNIIPLPNIPEKTVNGLTYSTVDGIVSVSGTASTFTLIDLGVNLAMMDGINNIGYKIFIFDGTMPMSVSIVLGIAVNGNTKTITSTEQEKASTGLVTFNSKNIGVAVNNGTAVDFKFGITVVPVNTIPSKFLKGRKYIGESLDELICVSNMWAFGDNVSKIFLNTVYRFKKNNLYGKSLFVAGDSVAYGYGSDNISFGEIIAKNNNMRLTKVARSGTTFAKRDGLTNSILEQIKSIDKEYDYIIVEGGFNDYFQRYNGVSIGTMPKNMNSSRDDKTTYGALDSICLWLKQNYPTSKILFVVPHKIMTITGVIDSEFYPYLQAIRDVCEKYSIPYADIALKGGCTPFYQEFRDAYFSGDGIHPNLEGYESFYVPRIEAEMEML